MKIVGIAACTAGIAHTYIAKQKLMDAAEARGHEIHIATQGTIGTEDALLAEDIKNADCAIIAADVKISGKERFENLRTFEVPTELVIKSPNKFIQKVEEVMSK